MIRPPISTDVNTGTNVLQDDHALDYLSLLLDAAVEFDADEPLNPILEILGGKTT